MVLMSLTFGLLFGGRVTIDSDGYFLADNWVKTGKVEGDGVAIIVPDVDSDPTPNSFR